MDYGFSVVVVVVVVVIVVVVIVSIKFEGRRGVVWSGDLMMMG